MRLYDTHGTLIAEWPLTAYGKANRGDFGFMESSDAPAIRQATMTALRDAGAFLALRFTTVPEVRAWLNSRVRTTAAGRTDVKSFLSAFASVACWSSLSCIAAGCVTTTVQEIRQASTGISHSESVVVLGRHNNAADESEDDFVSCVSNNLSGGKNGVGVVTEAAFVDAMFPWFEPRTAPLNTSDLPEIVNQPILADKLNSIGVRYVIWIEGNTQRTAQGGAMTCSVSVAGAGCFGFLSWENDSSYEALDLGHQERHVGRQGQFGCERHQLHAGGDRADSVHRAGAERRL